MEQILGYLGLGLVLALAGIGAEVGQTPPEGDIAVLHQLGTPNRITPRALPTELADKQVVTLYQDGKSFLLCGFVFAHDAFASFLTYIITPQLPIFRNWG